MYHGIIYFHVKNIMYYKYFGFDFGFELSTTYLDDKH